jgi:hypothetical protein
VGRSLAGLAGDEGEPDVVAGGGVPLAGAGWASGRVGWVSVHALACRWSRGGPETLRLLAESAVGRDRAFPQGYCKVASPLVTVGFPVVTAVMRSCGRWLASRVASAMLVAPLTRWYPIEVLRRVANTAGPLPVRA